MRNAVCMVSIAQFTGPPVEQQNLTLGVADRKRHRGANRRILPEFCDLDPANVEETLFFYDGWQCVEEQDAGGGSRDLGV